jgi:hypothetical protein
MTEDTLDRFTNPLTATLAGFLRSINLTVRAGNLPGPTFLPGLQIQHGALVVDESRLLDPGDLLHEAGHLAVVPPDRRASMHVDAGADAAEEMMAIAWSYAVTVHLQLDPAVVFHEHGYRGDAAALIDNFTHGRYIGVPMLQWVGMTLEPPRARERGLPPYPHMLRWLRGG